MNWFNPARNSTRLKRHPIDLIPPWSTLARFASSHLAKIAVIAPVFGALIIFNSVLVQWLTLSENALGMGSAAAVDLTLFNARWIYVGLLLLGLSAAVFGFRAPTEIKQYSSLDSWMSRERAETSASFEALRLANFAGDLLRRWRNGPNLESRRLIIQFSAVAGEAIRAGTHVDDVYQDLVADHKVAPPGIILAELSKFGEPHSWRRQAALVELRRRSVDLAIIEYGIKNYSRDWARSLCSVSLVMGTMALAVPSIKTALQVASIITGLSR